MITEISCAVKKKEDKGQILISFRGDGVVLKHWDTKENPEALASRFHVAWLRVRHENSNSHLLKLPVILQNSARGEKIIGLNPDELRTYLDLDEASVNRLSGRFWSLPALIVCPARPTREKQAVEFRMMLQSGEAQSKSDIARIMGVSRAWVTKVMK